MKHSLIILTLFLILFQQRAFTRSNRRYFQKEITSKNVKDSIVLICSRRPELPFCSASKIGKITQKRRSGSQATLPTINDNIRNNNLRASQSSCQTALSRVEQYCTVEPLPQSYVQYCGDYLDDCVDYLGDSEPLRRLASIFSSSIGVRLPAFSITGLPYYPFNDQGRFEAGYQGKADFGTYGGGWTDRWVVSDFFEKQDEYGGNWYDGVYGFRKTLAVPILRHLGAEGSGGLVVRAPLNEHGLGKFGLHEGFNVGPYWGQDRGLDVDVPAGVVDTGFHFGVPVLGINGVVDRTTVTFPSLDTFGDLLFGQNIHRRYRH